MTKKMSWTLSHQEWLFLYRFLKDKLPTNEVANGMNEMVVMNLFNELEKKILKEGIIIL
jgi:hypothetical protein